MVEAMGETSAGETMLEVRGLRTEFKTEEGTIAAVDGASWSVRRGETLALVGESGCGKTVTGLSILRLLPEPPARITGGEILLRDESGGGQCNIVSLSDRQMRRIRGNRIAMIFQEPLSALNPVLTIGEQIAEAVQVHRKIGRRAAFEAARAMLEQVGIPEPAERVRAYPHQLSGGMRQRVMIAMALSCDPSVLIADEPTTALDVTVAAQIMELLGRMQEANGMSVVFITHDLSVVAQIADRVCVMYAGRIVEQGPVRDLFAAPLHPYTQGLLRSLPRPGAGRKRLEVIPGSVPDPLQYPAGCRFHPRCDVTRRRSADGRRRTQTVPLDGVPTDVLTRCVRDSDQEPGGLPELRALGGDRWVACWEAEGYAESVGSSARP